MTCRIGEETREGGRRRRGNEGCGDAKRSTGDREKEVFEGLSRWRDKTRHSITLVSYFD